jgi:ribosomal protein S18 acetylase RimI-like enzyme
MMGLVNRLQQYLREKAQFDGRERVSIPPFSLFFNPSVTISQEGIAIPDSAAGHTPDDIGRVCAAFIERGRVPCVQFLDGYAPGLTIALELGSYPFAVPETPPPAPLPVYGEGEKASKQPFKETLRLPVMYCTAGMLVNPPEVPGLAVTMADSDAALDEIKDGWNVNSRGFDPEPVIATDGIAEEFRKTLVTSRAFTARLNGEPVGAGMFTEIHDGLTELVGITTLEAYRRRGIGAALTADMTRAAFDSGVEVVFLIAASEAARRVYKRLGFLPIVSLVEYQQEVKS